MVVVVWYNADDDPAHNRIDPPVLVNVSSAPIPAPTGFDRFDLFEFQGSGNPPAFDLEQARQKAIPWIQTLVDKGTETYPAPKGVMTVTIENAR